ncbi:hypothetical protein BZL54_16885 [Burkholderia ubonensis subsp. mesacidophila]|uniref:Uncharacterized protein n=1 Tax=Burkholderia ubonensis subsp. mesacidophila TaxID=265293 RepID=A0A2A4FCU9_9BURK|nr:hypothetical protein BZL54_16885 [Burkholderia ubonensis subsp. mesacidophila]
MESIGIVAPQTMHLAEPLRLQSGSVIGNYQLVVETYGELNAARSNAVLSGPYRRAPGNRQGSRPYRNAPVYRQRCPGAQGA